MGNPIILEVRHPEAKIIYLHGTGTGHRIKRSTTQTNSFPIIRMEMYDGGHATSDLSWPLTRVVMRNDPFRYGKVFQRNFAGMATMFAIGSHICSKSISLMWLGSTIQCCLAFSSSVHAVWCRRTLSTLVQVIACRLAGTKPLSECWRIIMK